MISPVESHSGVQEERHSRVQDPLQQRPGSGIEKYGTKVQAMSMLPVSQCTCYQPKAGTSWDKDNEAATVDQKEVFAKETFPFYQQNTTIRT